MLTSRAEPLKFTKIEVQCKMTTVLFQDQTTKQENGIQMRFEPAKNSFGEWNKILKN